MNVCPEPVLVKRSILYINGLALFYNGIAKETLCVFLLIELQWLVRTPAVEIVLVHRQAIAVRLEEDRLMIVLSGR